MVFGPLQKEFDNSIGRLDRCLSEFLLLQKPDIDEANRQTLKHHADDLIGVGEKMLKELGLMEAARRVETTHPPIWHEEKSKPNPYD